jgi:hypothetical protein
MKLFRKPIRGDVYEVIEPNPEVAVMRAADRNKSILTISAPETDPEQKKSLTGTRVRFILNEVGDVVGYVPLDPRNRNNFRRAMARNRLLWKEMENENSNHQ